MKYERGVLDNFNLLIKQSLPLVDGYAWKDISTNRFYFEKRYSDQIVNYFNLTGRKSNEFHKVKGHDDVGICSFASSGRLCFLLLNGVRDIKFEWHELNGTSPDSIWEKPSIRDAQYDAYDGKTFYECKCQEIFNEHDSLPDSYIPVLKDYFGIEVESVDGKIVGKASDFLIDDIDKDYKELHFDLKQLFTHLCGIIKAKGNVDKYTLKYIFFKPKQELINGYPIIKAAYESLDKELAKITKSTLFKEKCHIKFTYEYVYVDNGVFGADPKVIYTDMLKKTIKKYEKRIK